MINHFLTKLDNRNTSFPGIIRSENDVVSLSGTKKRIWDAIFSSVNSSEHFRIACAITLILKGSVLSDFETIDDSRVSYTDAELADILIGDGTSVTPGFDLSFIVTQNTPSKQSWSVKYLGSGEIQSTDEDGNRLIVSGLSFSTSEKTVFDLAGRTAKASMYEPTDGYVWTIQRNESFILDISGISSRLNDIDDEEIESILPNSIKGIYKNANINRNILRLLAAAIGVVNG